MATPSACSVAIYAGISFQTHPLGDKHVTSYTKAIITAAMHYQYILINTSKNTGDTAEGGGGNAREKVCRGEEQPPVHSPASNAGPPSLTCLTKMVSMGSKRFPCFPEGEKNMHI